MELLDIVAILLFVSYLIQMFFYVLYIYGIVRIDEQEIIDKYESYTSIRKIAIVVFEPIAYAIYKVAKNDD